MQPRSQSATYGMDAFYLIRGKQINKLGLCAFHFLYISPVLFKKSVFTIVSLGDTTFPTIFPDTLGLAKSHCSYNAPNGTLRLISMANSEKYAALQ